MKKLSNYDYFKLLDGIKGDIRLIHKTETIPRDDRIIIVSEMKLKLLVGTDRQNIAVDLLISSLRNKIWNKYNEDNRHKGI